MSDDELLLHKSAIDWVKQNHKLLFEELISGLDFESGELPSATFMAGTPGAGKTEISRRLIEKFEVKPICIDADEFRTRIPGYNGQNSDIVQSAASLAVEKVLEHAFKYKYPFLLDGTFAIGKAVENLKRALRRNYTMQLLFVYQDPQTAWEFTKIRQSQEGRFVPKETFINAYFASRNNANKAKEIFGNKLILTLIVKDYKKGTEKIYDNISKIEESLPKLYNQEELNDLIN